MAVQFKSFEPRAGVDEGLTISVVIPPVESVNEEGETVYDRKPGEALDITEWPHTANSSEEERVLDNHPLLKVVSAKKARETQQTGGNS